MTRARMPLCLMAAAWMGGCTGSIATGMSPEGADVDDPSVSPVPGGGKPGTTGSVGGGAAGAAAAGGATPSTTSAVASGARVFRRLTLAEIKAAVKDLVGDAPFATDVDEVHTERANDGEYTTQAATRAGFDTDDVQAIFRLAQATAQATFLGGVRRVALVGCTPARADDPCVRAFVTGFGRRAFRRPLTPAQTDRYTALVPAAVAMGADVWVGLEHVVAGMLASPNFLYLPVLGEPDPARPRIARQTGWELASRMAFALTGGPPDIELLDAAARGQLGSADGVRAQARRLMARSDLLDRGVVKGFFAEYFELQGLDSLGKDAKTYPQATATLAAAMRQEIEKVVTTLVAGDLPFSRALTSRDTYANDELAKIYGLAGVGKTMTKVTWPEAGARQGILGLSSFLALNGSSNNSSPPNRGKFVRQRLLCQPILPPPPDIDLAAADLGLPAVRTKRTESEARMKLGACAGCHAFIDPPGLALDGFDGMGVQRTTDRGLPLNLDVTIDGTPVSGLPGLAQLVQSKPALAACLARHMYRHATGAREDDAVAGVLEEIATRNPGVNRMLVELIASDPFRTFATGGTP